MSLRAGYLFQSRVTGQKLGNKEMDSAETSKMHAMRFEGLETVLERPLWMRLRSSDPQVRLERGERIKEEFSAEFSSHRSPRATHTFHRSEKCPPWRGLEKFRVRPHFRKLLGDTTRYSEACDTGASVSSQGIPTCQKIPSSLVN